MYGNARKTGIAASAKARKLLFLRLKGRAKRFPRGACLMRAYCDLACGAVGFTIMVVAVLNVALNALDMLTATTVLVLLFFHHFIRLPLLFRLRKY